MIIPTGNTEGDWLRQLGVTSSPLTLKGIATARRFFALRMSTLPLDLQLSFIRGMDLHSDVTETLLPRDTAVAAFRYLRQAPLQLFYTKPGVSPHQLGIDVDGRFFRRFRLSAPTVVLQSRCASVITTWADDPKHMASGGGIQWIIPTAASTLVVVPNRKPRPANVTQFVAMALPAATAVKTNWRVPIAVVIAQAALETGWGSAVKGNAYFGIKGHKGTAAANDSVAFKTTEFLAGKRVSMTDTFRAYTSFADAADDYGRFLNENPRYRAAFNYVDDPNGFVDKIAQAGYATDPLYADKLKTIIRSYYLTDLDQ